MRKANIIDYLKRELVKGKEYIVKDGDIVSKEFVLNNIKKDYIKSIEDGSIDMTLSYSEYEEYHLAKAVKVDDILNCLVNKYGI